MKRFLLQSLYFTRVERIGTALLLLLCALLYSTPYVLRALFPKTAPLALSLNDLPSTIPEMASPPVGPATLRLESFEFDPNKATMEEFVRLGLSAKTAQSIGRYRDKGGKFRKPEDFKKIYALRPADYERLLPFIKIGGPPQKQSEGMPKTAKPAVAELFEFDPNTASADDFKRLGLPESAVKGLLAYRGKGGIFRKKEDLQKIYTLPPADYERVAPYIVVPAVNKNTTGVEALRPAAYQSGVLALASRPKQPVGPVDLNRSSIEDWMALPGIGEKRARQIIQFREKLGGFLSVEQVAETRNLPDSVFQVIRPLLVHGFAEVRLINLNTVSRADLSTHPYCSAKQAEHIVNYRDQHGPYRSVAELDQIEAFKDKRWLAQIKQYLRVD